MYTVSRFGGLSSSKVRDPCALGCVLSMYPVSVCAQRKFVLNVLYNYFEYFYSIYWVMTNTRTLTIEEINA